MPFFIFVFSAVKQFHFKCNSCHRPLPPSPSPKGRERFCISLIKFITTISSLFLYSSFSNIPVIRGVFKKLGLCHGKPSLWEGWVGFYLVNAVATPPSTFNVLPVDLFNKPPTNAKQALAISSGKIVSFNKVLFA